MLAVNLEIDKVVSFNVNGRMIEFRIYKKDKESLYKKIDENISIGFDIEFFFGFIFKNKRLKKSIRTKYETIIKKYAESGFIGNIFFGDNIIGGHIKIDNFDDINIVFSNYKSLEEEASII